MPKLSLPSRDLWSELMVKWPRSYWDDWMREPAQRKGFNLLTSGSSLFMKSPFAL